MNYWHMQLHPNDRGAFDEDKIRGIVLKVKAIGMGTEWANDGGQPLKFKEEMQIGDLVLIRPSYILVQVISDWYVVDSSNLDDDLDWYPLRRDIKVLSDAWPQNWKDFDENIYRPTTLSIVLKKIKKHINISITGIKII